MTQCQIDVINELFVTEALHAQSGGQGEVLHDAPPLKVAFMEQLIAEGSVYAYKTRSKGCGLPCYMLSAITPKGRSIYGHGIIKKESESKEVSNGKVKERKSNEQETPEA